MASQVSLDVHVPTVLGQGQEKVRLLQHMLEGRLLAGPLGPAAQYDFQQLNAVQVSLRSTDLHGGFFHCLLTTGLILCASRLVTLGLAVCPRGSSVRCAPWLQPWCHGLNSFAQVVATL